MEVYPIKDECVDTRDNPRFGMLAALSKDERGVAVIEYALICALIALAIVASLGQLGGANADTFDNIGTHLNVGGHGHGRGGGNSGQGVGNGDPVGG